MPSSPRDQAELDQLGVKLLPADHPIYPPGYGLRAALFRDRASPAKPSRPAREQVPPPGCRSLRGFRAPAAAPAEDSEAPVTPERPERQADLAS